MEYLDAVRARLLPAALAHVPFDGWTARTLARAAADAGVGHDDLLRACPNGAADLVAHWVAQADRDMVAALGRRDLKTMKVRERIACAIRARLEPLAPHREAVRRALALQALPGRSAQAPRQLYRTVDAIWQAVGDGATDWSFYSRRLLLAGVYSATLLYWLNDRSDDASATWAFLDRRLADVMRLGRVRPRLESLAGRLPDPFELLRRVRR